MKNEECFAIIIVLTMYNQEYLIICTLEVLNKSKFEMSLTKWISSIYMCSKRVRKGKKPRNKEDVGIF